jgi:hypothetical protein
VRDLEHEYIKGCVLDLVNDAIVAGAHSVDVFGVGKFLAPGGPGFFSK